MKLALFTGAGEARPRKKLRLSTRPGGQTRDGVESAEVGAETSIIIDTLHEAFLITSSLFVNEIADKENTSSALCAYIPMAPSVFEHTHSARSVISPEYMNPAPEIPLFECVRD